MRAPSQRCQPTRGDGSGAVECARELAGDSPHSVGVLAVVDGQDERYLERGGGAEGPECRLKGVDDVTRRADLIQVLRRLRAACEHVERSATAPRHRH